MKKILVIGAGNMGGALVEGFLKSGKITPENIFVCDKSAAVRAKFEAKGVRCSDDISFYARFVEIVIIAVKPYLIESVSAEAAGIFSGKTIISVAAGVNCETLKKALGQPCFNVIPNIAATYGASMTFISYENLLEYKAKEVEDLFALVGSVAVVDEKQLDSAMVLASCGTAYALRYIRAAMEAGIEMGLTSETAKLAVAQTVKGAAEILLNNKNMHPEEAVDMVTTPGGITIAGLNELEHSGFTSSVIGAHIAAYQKVKG